MAGSKDLLERVEREIAASSRTSATPPGPTDNREQRITPERVEAINQVFALFRLNYHNQYYAAYPDAQQLSQIKKLWLDSLAEYTVEQILQGAKHAIENSEYLPTLHRMHECCREGLLRYGLPSLRDAYIEACMAPSPKIEQPWSHPAVYLAGRDAGWFFLARQGDQQALPVFREHYTRYCARVMRGEELELPRVPAIEELSGTPMTREQKLQALARLRRETGLG